MPTGPGHWIVDRRLTEGGWSHGLQAIWTGPLVYHRYNGQRGERGQQATMTGSTDAMKNHAHGYSQND